MVLSIRTIGLRTAVADLKTDIDDEIEKGLRENALKAFADVKLATPVDTGRARNSWYIGYNETFLDTDTPGVIILQKRNVPTEIIVTNGTQYIQFLNDGHSEQAPTKFIENAFLRYFDEVRVETVDN